MTPRELAGALRLRFDLQDGMEVIAKGRLIVYVPRGEYQLQVEEIQPRGIGPLELAFRQLKEKLSARGYFEPRRKRHHRRLVERRHHSPACIDPLRHGVAPPARH